MSKRSSDLLQEMQGIFGSVFGAATESTETIIEAQRPMPKHEPSKKGLLHKKKGGLALHGGGDKKKSGVTLKAKRLLKAAAKKKGDEDEKRFQGVMKDIRGEMDKSHKKSMEKKKDRHDSEPSGGGSATPKAPSAASKSARRHFPFKRNANLGPGPRHDHHDETKCWKCKCGNIYSDGCNCVASGNGENCPPKGTHKKISYNKSYKRDYNNEYHAWRARQGGAVTRRLGSTR